MLLAAVALAAMAVGPLAVPAAAAAPPSIAGSWASAPSFPSVVVPYTVTAGRDGRLYLFGDCQAAPRTCPQRNGAVGDGATVMEVYDPATARWRPGVHPPAVCSGDQGSPSASALDANGNIELAGCWNDSGSSQGFRVAVYHPGTATWTVEPGRGPRADPIAGMAGPGGSMLWFSATLRNDNGAILRSGYRVLVDRAGAWTSGAAMGGFAPSDAAVAGPAGQVLAFGGDRDCQAEFGPCAVAKVRAYRVSTNTWRNVTALPTPRMRLAAATDRLGRVFLMGGFVPGVSTPLTTVDVYLPATNQWARTGALHAGRFQALATATPDGRVWLLGGYDADGQLLRTVEVFTPHG